MSLERAQGTLQDKQYCSLKNKQYLKETSLFVS